MLAQTPAEPLLLSEISSTDPPCPHFFSTPIFQPSRAGLPQVPHSSYKTVPKPYEPHTQAFHSNDTATCTNLLLVTFLFIGKKHPKIILREGGFIFAHGLQFPTEWREHCGILGSWSHCTHSQEMRERNATELCSHVRVYSNWPGQSRKFLTDLQWWSRSPSQKQAGLIITVVWNTMVIKWFVYLWFSQCIL